MNNGRVNASPEDLRRLAASLAAFQREVTEASRRVQGALERAQWQDSQKTKFENRFRDLQATVRRFMGSDVNDMIASLNELARRLDEIKQIRM